jgi:hypothetical protein
MTMKTAAEPQEELILTPPPAVKPSRDEAIAERHLTRQRDKLLKKRTAIDGDLARLDAALIGLKG